MKCLTSHEILGIHDALVQLFASEADPISPSGPRDPGLVESAANRPLTALGGTQKYPADEAKISALFHSLVTSHPFHNGNKRTAVVSMVVLIGRMDRYLQISDDELFDFVISVADGSIKAKTANGSADEVVEVIRQWLHEHTSPQADQIRRMKTKEFLEHVRSAGGSYRPAKRGGSWVVRGPAGKSIRISQSTPELDGPVVRTYLQRLGMTLPLLGMGTDEFLDGLSPEQQAIQKFKKVLHQLARF